MHLWATVTQLNPPVRFKLNHAGYSGNEWGFIPSESLRGPPDASSIPSLFVEKSTEAEAHSPSLFMTAGSSLQQLYWLILHIIAAWIYPNLSMIYFTGGASVGGSPSEWSTAPSQTFASELHLLLWTRFFAILSATRLLVILQCLLLVSCGHAPPIGKYAKKKG